MDSECACSIMYLLLALMALDHVACRLQVLQHYKDRVARIVADKSADDVAKQIREAVQQ